METKTTKELAELLNVSVRTVQRHLTTLQDEIKNRGNKGVLLPLDVFELLKNRVSGDTSTTFSETENEEEFDYVEAFTTEEYLEFQKRINEYPVLREYIENLKEQIEFLRFNSIQQTETIKELSAGIKQRNFIEAKEKKLDH